MILNNRHEKSASMPDSEEVVFRTRGLTKVYQMGDVSVHALRGIDMELYAGELVVLLGPSGMQGRVKTVS